MKRIVICILVSVFQLLVATNQIAHSATGRIVLMWQVQKSVTDADLNLLSSLGVNTIQSFQLPFWTDSDIKTYLDKAQKYNLKVVVYLGKFIKVSKHHISIDEKGLTNFLNMWKTHPAVFAWQPLDEPSNNLIDSNMQENVYKLIKKIDGKTPVFLSWNGNNKEDYDCCFANNAFDIMDIHKYVDDDITWTQTNLIKFTREYYQAVDNKQIIITLRAFNGTAPMPWKSLRPNSLEMQYNYFFRQNNITNNIGFYGWQLSPNIGISQDDNIKAQFIEFAKKHF